MVVPLIPQSAHVLLDSHRQRGDLLVLTTATNRFITEMTAAHLELAHLVATETELVNGQFTGRTQGILNMQEGKVLRLRAWLDEQGLPMSMMADASFYSDSANDLPLLRAVAHPVAVDPDEQLLGVATSAGWPVQRLVR